MPTCQYCTKPTRSTYRDERFDDRNLNLINCCPNCATSRNYLTISSIWKPHPATISEPSQETL